MKTCSKCKQSKSLDEFGKCTQNRDGKNYWCRPCCRTSHKKWYDNNPDKARQHARDYYDKNREKARQYGRDYHANNREKANEASARWRANNPDKKRNYKYQRRARASFAVPQRWRKSECPETLCYWCGTDLANVEVHTEHLMPLALRGEAKPYNEAPACSVCNRAKHDKHPLVWIASLVS
jgi:hypothetical protein